MVLKPRLWFFSIKNGFLLEQTVGFFLICISTDNIVSSVVASLWRSKGMQIMSVREQDRKIEFPTSTGQLHGYIYVNMSWLNGQSRCKL
jgi:hypothetical protein